MNDDVDSLEIEKSDLAWAVEQGLVTVVQGEKLWGALVERKAAGGGVRVSASTGVVEERATAAVRARFDLVHVAWSGGSLLVMGALGWFATLGFDRWGGPGILAISLAYLALFGGVGVTM